MSRGRVMAISAVAGALIGAILFFFIMGWGAAMGALLGAAGRSLLGHCLVLG